MWSYFPLVLLFPLANWVNAAPEDDIGLCNLVDQTTVASVINSEEYWNCISA